MKRNTSSVLSYYDKKGYQEYKVGHDRLEHIYLKNLLSKQSVDGKSIIEIGAGASQYRDIFLSMNCRQYTGIEVVNLRIPQEIPDRCVYKCIDIHDFETEERFDIVFFSLTYMYLGDRHQVLRKCAQMLVPNGVIIFIEPNYLSLITLVRTVFGNIFKKMPIIPFLPYKLKSDLKKLGLLVEHHSFFTRDKKILSAPMIATNTKILARKQFSER